MNAIQTIAISLVAGAIQAAVLDFAMKHKDGMREFFKKLTEKTADTVNPIFRI